MIELDEVSKHYDGKVAVDRVSLRVAPGELVVLLGGSGSGKTTTLKMTNRLIEPTSGRVRIDGEDVTAVPAPSLRRRIGYVFQRLGLFPHLTVAENVGITPALLGWDATRIRDRVDALLALVELDADEIRDRRPDALSGGQAQRVAVARALAAEPSVLLLDEPFGALDPITRERLQQSFVRVRKTLGFSAIFVTHDVVEALLLGDRVGVMRDGRLLQLAPGRELVRAPVDDYVADLVRGPLAQARVVESLIAGAPVAGGDAA
ncbi:putative ABC transporter ATP-binding protein [Minicystis rosea]|nr:putative ABC transporter ATP-binding protein [Minicystis rosea]